MTADSRELRRQHQQQRRHQSNTKKQNINRMRNEVIVCLTCKSAIFTFYLRAMLGGTLALNPFHTINGFCHMCALVCVSILMRAYHYYV